MNSASEPVMTAQEIRRRALAPLSESLRMAKVIEAGGAAAEDGALAPAVTYRAARAWFEAHLEILLALMDDAAEADAWDVVIALSDNLTVFLLRAEAWAELQRAASLAVAASEALGDTGGEIRARQARAMANRRMGEEADAEADFQRVDVLTAARGDPGGRAPLLAQWAQSKQDFGRLQEANRMLRQAATLYREAASRAGEAKTLTDLGDLLAREGATEAAMGTYSEAREIFSEIGDRRNEAVVLHHMGVAHARDGRWQEGLAAFTAAASTSQEVGDELRAARVLWLRAKVHWQLKNYAEAEADAQRALPALQTNAETAAEIASMLSGADAMRAIDALIAAPDEGARRAVVIAHPELLTPDAESILVQRLDSAKGQRRSTQSISDAQHTLAALHEQEMGRRFAAIWGELEALATGEAPLPQSLRSVIREIATTGDGDDQRRLQLRRHALALVRQQEHPRVWVRLNRELAGDLLRAEVPGAADRHDEAIATLEHTLRVIDRHEDAEEWFYVQCELGRVYRSRPRGNPTANTETAISCFERALAHLPPGLSALDRAAAIHDLGNAYVDLPTDDRKASVERAIRCYEQALGVFTCDARPGEWARVQTNLANAYLQHPDRTPENTQKAVRCLQDALAVAEAGGPQLHALALQHLAKAYQRQTEGDRVQNIERAIPLLQRALQELERAGARSSAAAAAHNLGIAYMNRLVGPRAENVEDAIRCYEQALAHLSREDAPAQWAATTDNLANAYNNRAYGRQAENIERAIALQESALEVYGPDFLPLEWARTLFNLAGSLRRRTGGDLSADLQRATQLYEQALAVRRRDIVPVEWAETVENLAATWSSRTDGDEAGNLTRAESLYQRALEVFRSERALAAVQRTAGGLGDVLSALGRWSDAVASYREAVEASESFYQSSLLRGSKNIELGEAGDLSRRAAYALARAGDAKAAVVALERGRARALGESLGRDRADLAELREAAPALFAAYQRAAERARRIESIERLTADHKSAADAAESRNALGAEARDAQAELAAAVDAIRAMPGQERFASPPSFSDIADAASAERPLAYVVVTPWGGMALIVSAPADGVDATVTTVRRDDLTLAWLDRLLVTSDGDTVVGGYLPAQLGDGSDLDAALQDLLPELGRLAEPIAAHLRSIGAAAVTLVPTGGLGLVPLHAGLYLRPEGPRSLLDDFAVAYAPSARAATSARLVKSSESGKRHLLAVSNPTGDLPYARLEVDLIRRLFISQEVLLGDDATKTRVVDTLRRCSNVHFACHGRYDSDDPLASHLALADGPLTLRDVIDAGSFAGVDLVVASSCQSAVTEFDRIPDEAIGFPSGFLQAGAAGIVATLWSVADLSCSMLMDKFYEVLLELPPNEGDASRPVDAAAALGRAQRWLRDLTAGQLANYASRHPAFAAALGPAVKFARLYPNVRPFAGPSHWAPYVYVGA